MPSTPLHDPADSPVAELFVCAKRAFLHRTFKLAFKALDKPVNLEVNAGVNQGVEVAAGVFQREGVGVRQIRCNLHMKLCR